MNAFGIVREMLVPEAARDHIGSLSMKRVIDWLLAPDGRFGDDPLKGPDEVLVRSFREAIDELTERFGSDVRRWRYGGPEYKHALIEHPLARAVNDKLRAKMNVGPLPRGDDSFTVNADYSAATLSTSL